MAGSPKKRAKREAAEREKTLAAVAQTAEQLTCNQPVVGATPTQGTNISVPVVQGEILPPVDATEPTRTALKRAMRARAQEHADAAIAVLVEALGGSDKKEARSAANDLLAWGFGKPATEIEAGDGAQMIVIRRFGDVL